MLHIFIMQVLYIARAKGSKNVENGVESEKCEIKPDPLHHYGWRTTPNHDNDKSFKKVSDTKSYFQLRKLDLQRYQKMLINLVDKKSLCCGFESAKGC